MEYMFSRFSKPNKCRGEIASESKQRVAYSGVPTLLLVARLRAGTAFITFSCVLYDSVSQSPKGTQLEVPTCGLVPLLGADAVVSVRLTWMSAGDTDSTGCENVSVRNTFGCAVVDPFLPPAKSGASSQPTGLHQHKLGRSQC